MEVTLQKPVAEVSHDLTGALLALVQRAEVALVDGIEQEVEGGGSMAEPLGAEGFAVGVRAGRIDGAGFAHGVLRGSGRG